MPCPIQQTGFSFLKLLVFFTLSVFILLVLGVVLASKGGLSPDGLMADINGKVVDDAIKMYQIAKRNGDKVQTCVQAGMVSASALQAKDEKAYAHWKATEKADCRRAGLPNF